MLKNSLLQAFITANTSQQTAAAQTTIKKSETKQWKNCIFIFNANYSVMCNQLTNKQSKVSQKKNGNTINFVWLHICILSGKYCHALAALWRPSTKMMSYMCRQRSCSECNFTKSTFNCCSRSRCSFFSNFCLLKSFKNINSFLFSSFSN